MFNQFIDFSKFDMLGNHHHFAVSQLCHHPTKFAGVCMFAVNSQSHLQPQATTDLLTLSIDLSFLEMSHK